MAKRYVTLLLMSFLILVVVSACNNSSQESETEELEQEESAEQEDDTEQADNKSSEEVDDEIDLTLTELLPNEKGYMWNYDGAVEYGHEMILKSIEESDEQVTYTVEGDVEDPSGGESENDFSLDVTYTVTEDNIRQTVDSDMMMDNNFSEIELIRAPLSEGNEWTQTQTNAEGEDITLESSIDSVEQDGEQKIYTVIYEDSDSEYYEKRQIKEGVGVLSFEYLYIAEDEEDNMPMGYEINYDYTGYLDD